MMVVRRGLSAFAGPLGLLLCGTGAPGDARIRQPQISEILIDASTGTVLYAHLPDAPRHPASLTKMMTLYLAFDALGARQLTLKDHISVSRIAARQPPSRLGLAAGSSLSIRQALRAIAVLSANDVAVALAEKLAVNERQFARRMTLKARALGMSHTRFANATGLPHGGNVTTARDMATLSRAILQHHAPQYPLFGTRSIRWDTHRIENHNHLLGKVPGVDGLKTGYTADAGYNLAASARRGRKRVVAVILGEKSASSRDVRMSNLLEFGFNTSMISSVTRPHS